MLNKCKKLLGYCAMAALVVVFSGCGKSEGTAEGAGKKADDAMEKTNDAAKDAAKDLGDE